MLAAAALDRDARLNRRGRLPSAAPDWSVARASVPPYASSRDAHLDLPDARPPAYPHHLLSSCLNPTRNEHTGRKRDRPAPPHDRVQAAHVPRCARPPPACRPVQLQVLISPVLRVLPLPGPCSQAHQTACSPRVRLAPLSPAVALADSDSDSLHLHAALTPSLAPPSNSRNTPRPRRPHL